MTSRIPDFSESREGDILRPHSSKTANQVQIVPLPLEPLQHIGSAASRTGASGRSRITAESPPRSRPSPRPRPAQRASPERKRSLASPEIRCHLEKSQQQLVPRHTPRRRLRVHSGHRPSEEIALSFIAVLRDQGAALFVRLDPFRRDGDAELVAELEDCADDRIIASRDMGFTLKAGQLLACITKALATRNSIAAGSTSDSAENATTPTSGAQKFQSIQPAGWGTWIAMSRARPVPLDGEHIARKPLSEQSIILR